LKVKELGLIFKNKGGVRFKRWLLWKIFEKGLPGRKVRAP